MATQTTPEPQALAPAAPRDTSRSRALLERARTLFPGGVNSPVRAFGGVGGEPFFVARGEGARIWDADGNAYLDYVLSWGPLVLGHAPRVVLDALHETMQRGTSFGIPTELETQLGEAIRARMPHVEMLRFVSSGTEATMTAVRLARAVTGRDAILKFDGCYHGHGDSFLVRAGSGVATLGLPNSPGRAERAGRADAHGDVQRRRRGRGHRRRRGPPPRGDHRRAGGRQRRLHPARAGLPRGAAPRVRPHGALLIFDEVMTGFRVAFGGATEAFGVTPDLVTLGKVVGGGLPVAAYGGRAALMQHVAPVGRMYQAGTLSGNPLAMAGGLATLAALTREVHDGIVARTATLVEGCARSPSGTACRARRGTPGRCGASSSTRARCARSTTPARGTSRSSAASSTRRSTAGSTSRRRPSRRGS
jgi:glutamate-1-semialdehyde 2,1-aminomutase